MNTFLATTALQPVVADECDASGDQRRQSLFWRVEELTLSKIEPEERSYRDLAMNMI